MYLSHKFQKDITQELKSTELFFIVETRRYWLELIVLPISKCKGHTRMYNCQKRNLPYTPCSVKNQCTITT